MAQAGDGPVAALGKAAAQGLPDEPCRAGDQDRRHPAGFLPASLRFAQALLPPIH
jgi:hypothetical protein